MFAQDIPVNTEQQLENLTDAEQSETEDDSWLQQMEQFKKHPLNLNTADITDLRELRTLSDLQITNFLNYRKLLGKLVSIYELQAIPTWDIGTIRKLLPYIIVTNAEDVFQNLSKRLKQGDHTLLLRTSQVLEKSVGYDKTPGRNYYLGSPQRLFFRYKYQYRNLLQFGLTGDKDAGEQFFSGKQKAGFDFYSVHFFARKIGIVQALAVGDFTVNMGQGLIQWQSLAFKKNSDVTGIKRQSPVLRPYSSAGEFNFQRGAGVTIKKGTIETTLFGSVRKLSANIVSDTINNEDYFSSFLTSGYNRSQSEINDRNKLQQLAYGAVVSFNKSRLHVGINAIAYNFSIPLQKRPEPYNAFSIRGKNWSNYSIDYSYTFKNLHFFGEAAADKNFNKAFINGLLISVDSRVDVALLHRSIGKQYQAVNANAFTENTFPTNESGLYAGVSIRPTSTTRIDAYADVYSFPWLKYLVDAPSTGKDFLVQLTYTPDKKTELYTRYRAETKQSNFRDNATVTNYLVFIPRQSWRTQFAYQINKNFTLRNRLEMIWYDKENESRETGFLSFADCIYNPTFSRVGGSLRLQYFESDSYNSRLYAYENDLLYNYSIPVFFDKGWRYYLNWNYRPTKTFAIWAKWGQTIYRKDKEDSGSGLDMILANKKSEIKLQLVINL